MAEFSSFIQFDEALPVTQHRDVYPFIDSNQPVNSFSSQAHYSRLSQTWGSRRDQGYCLNNKKSRVPRLWHSQPMSRTPSFIVNVLRLCLHILFRLLTSGHDRRVNVLIALDSFKCRDPRRLSGICARVDCLMSMIQSCDRR